MAWERVRHRQPAFQPVYLDLADDYTKLGERRKAIDVLKIAHQRWPKDADVLNALGVTEAGAGAIDDAIKRFKEAIAVAPAETISYLNLGKSLELHYFKKRQYLAGPRLWVSDEHARQDAISSYQRYLALAGPYRDVAREGIARLKAVSNKPILGR